MSYSKRPHLNDQIEATRRAVQAAVSGVKSHPFGHAFLWGIVTVSHKNGKPAAFRVCLGSVCAEDLNEVVRIANSVPGVSNVYYNLD